MGNSISGGFGVLNGTQQQVNIGLSQYLTHYYENQIKPGEIFYVYPGAVFYTVFACCSSPSKNNDIKRLRYYSLTKAKFSVDEIHKTKDLFAANHLNLGDIDLNEVQQAYQNSTLYTEVTCCYGGYHGTWLILKGGPKINQQGQVEPGDYYFEVRDQKYIFNRGELTQQSNLKYQYPKKAQKLFDIDD